MIMNKIDQQDDPIKEFTTRGTQEERRDVINHEESKCSQLQL